MPSLKEFRNRIASVKSTQKITKAMQMVAAAKLKRAQGAAEAARPYANRMASVIANLSGNVKGDGAPLLLRGTGKDEVHLVVVLTSYFRFRIGRKWWKRIHFTTYALFPLYAVHAILTDPALKDRFAAIGFDSLVRPQSPGTRALPDRACMGTATEWPRLCSPIRGVCWRIRLG